MHIAIIGYGKMGKAIEAIALERGHTIGLKTRSSDGSPSIADLEGHDVAIEFTRPETAVQHITTCFEANVPVIVGTTGWYDNFEAIKTDCLAKKAALFYATNFSVGVNLFFELNQHLARLMNAYPSYATSMEEVHHTQKVDAPSGTAITLAEGIIKHKDNLTTWEEGATHPAANVLPITSKRIDAVPGTHSISYASEIDTIEITHTAHNRKGFATGAVLAAEWMQSKKGVYSMSDMLQLN